jgi:fatty-acyl-CoA synthase
MLASDGWRWFDTQDLVLPLPDGYVRFVGRLKRVIKRGPNLIHPEEVEAFLLTHPAVAAVAIVRASHELFGESMEAWVQPAPGATLGRGDLLAFCRGNIAAHKIPDRFAVVEDLPVDIGKIQYKRIRTNESKS